VSDTQASDGSTVKLSCKNSDCARDLHAFRVSKEQVESGTVGSCRSCGANLIDWPRVRARNLGDAAHTVESLKREWIRHRYWHTDLEQRAINYALRKGRPGMRDAVLKRVNSRLGPPEPYGDGWRTPWEAREPITYAQHAVAACCRECAEEWHGIPQGRALEQAEIDYLIDLMMLYVDEKVPEMTDERQYVAPIKSKRD
jgi:ribosomal protein L34E